MNDLTRSDYLLLMESLITLRFNFINRMSSCGDEEARLWSNQVDKIDVLFRKVQSNYRELREVSIRNTDDSQAPGHEPKGSFGI